MSREQHFLPSPVRDASPAANRSAAGCVQDCILEAKVYEEEMEVRTSHYLYFKTGMIPSHWRTHPSFPTVHASIQQVASPWAHCLREKFTLYYRQVQPEPLKSLKALEKVLLLSMAVASSTPTEQWWLYVSRNSKFPPSVPNRAHGGFLPRSHCLS